MVGNSEIRTDLVFLGFDMNAFITEHPPWRGKFELYNVTYREH